MVNRSFDFYFLNMYDKMKADLGLYGFHAIKPLIQEERTSNTSCRKYTNHQILYVRNQSQFSSTYFKQL